MSKNQQFNLFQGLKSLILQDIFTRTVHYILTNLVFILIHFDNFSLFSNFFVIFYQLLVDLDGLYAVNKLSMAILDPKILM